MVPLSPYDAKRIADMRAEEAMRRMRHRRLVREATANQGGWMVQRIAPLLRRLGRLLVAAGRRLQNLGSPRNAPIEGQATARALAES
jgi:hypothetical protein